MYKAFVTLLSVALAITALAFAQEEALNMVGEVESGLNENQQTFIQFQTEGAARSQVEYGVEGDFSNTTEEVTALDGMHYHVLSGLEPDTTYSYRLRIYDWSGNEITTDPMTLTTQGLTAPQGLRASTGDNRAILSWDPAFGASEYVVERADEAGGTFESLATVEGTSYTDESVTNEEEYVYRVSAVDAAGNATDPSEELSVVIEPALLNADFQTELDEETWRVYESNPEATVTVEDGQLRIEGLDTEGWEGNQKGVMFQQPLDLTGKVTTVEVDYVEAGYNEQNPGFWGEGDINGDDIWNHPGFRLTTGGGGFGATFTPPSDGSFESDLGAEATPPYTLRWVLTHQGGSNFTAEAFVDGESQGTSQMDMGSLDPSELYFYLYVSNNDQEGPAVFDRVSITQEPVTEGSQATGGAQEGDTGGAQPPAGTGGQDTGGAEGQDTGGAEGSEEEFMVEGCRPSDEEALSEEEREAGWQVLFDGESLDAWRGYRQEEAPEGWSIVGECLVRTGPGGDIITRETFDDFELALEWRISEGGNSGIFFNVTEEADAVYMTGPEMQVLDDARHPDGQNPLTSAGSNYALHAPTEDVARPVGEFNEVRIVVRGNRVEHWLNRTKVVEYELGSPEWQELVAASKFTEWPGYGQAESGHIALQDHGDPVWYRNIKIRPLEPGE